MEWNLKPIGLMSLSEEEEIPGEYTNWVHTLRKGHVTTQREVIYLQARETWSKSYSSWFLVLDFQSPEILEKKKSIV